MRMHGHGVITKRNSLIWNQNTLETSQFHSSGNPESNSPQLEIIFSFYDNII